MSRTVQTTHFDAPGKDGGTKLVLTEQGAFLDGFDDAGGREKGTEGLLNFLESFLKKND